MFKKVIFTLFILLAAAAVQASEIVQCPPIVRCVAGSRPTYCGLDTKWATKGNFHILLDGESPANRPPYALTYLYRLTGVGFSTIDHSVWRDVVKCIYINEFNGTHMVGHISSDDYQASPSIEGSSAMAWNQPNGGTVRTCDPTRSTCAFNLASL